MINRFIYLIENNINDKEEIINLYPSIIETIDKVNNKLTHVNTTTKLPMIIIELLKPIINSIKELEVLPKERLEILENYIKKGNIINEFKIDNNYKYKIEDNKIYLNEAYLTDIDKNIIKIVLDISSLVINNLSKEEINLIKQTENNRLLKNELIRRKELIMELKEQKVKKLIL